jgi:outer membrane protein assembly factor BamB
LLWSRATGTGPVGPATPTVSGGIVYVVTVGIDTSGERTALYAFDAKTGARKWHRSIGTDDVVGNALAPTVADGKVFIGTADGYVLTFNARTGAPGWATYIGSNNVDATVAVDTSTATVYAAVYGLGVFALNELDGTIIWESPVTSETDLLVGPIVSNPALSAGRLVVHVYLLRQDFSVENDVLALDATTGDVAWESPAGFDQRMTIANGVVYDGSLEGWDLNNGARVLNIGGLDSWVAISNGRVLGDGGGMLRSYGLP